MDDLEYERLLLEKSRVTTAKAEMRYNIKQRQSEIRRLEETMKIQEAKELELDATIQNAKKVST